MSVSLSQKLNKYLSCRRETALQGGSVLAKGRQYSADSIGLSSTAVT